MVSPHDPAAQRLATPRFDDGFSPRITETLKNDLAPSVPKQYEKTKTGDHDDDNSQNDNMMMTTVTMSAEIRLAGEDFLVEVPPPPFFPK